MRAAAALALPANPRLVVVGVVDDVPGRRRPATREVRADPVVVHVTLGEPIEDESTTQKADRTIIGVEIQ